MIQLTRLNNQNVFINSDLIKSVEQAPDTVITLLNGEKFIVRERANEVVQRITTFRRSVLQGVYPWDTPPAVTPLPEAVEDSSGPRGEDDPRG